jgi:hypothetical protein
MQCSSCVLITLTVETPHDRPGRFGPGNNGRSPGSYNRASRGAALAILDHFEEIQDRFLTGLAENRRLYISLLSKVLPRQIQIGLSGVEAMSDADVRQTFVFARGMLHGQSEGRAVLAELEAQLLGVPASDHRVGHR